MKGACIYKPYATIYNYYCIMHKLLKKHTVLIKYIHQRGAIKFCYQQVDKHTSYLAYACAHRDITIIPTPVYSQAHESNTSQWRRKQFLNGGYGYLHSA